MMSAASWARIAVAAVLLSAPCVVAAQPDAPVPVVAAAANISGSDLDLPAPSARAVRYVRIGYVLYAVGTVWMWAGLWLFCSRKWSARWRDLAERRAGSAFGRTAVYVAIYHCVYVAWNSPLAIAGALIEAHYGFSTRTAGLWALDFARAWAIGLATLFPVVLAAIWLVRRSPRRWWMWMWAACVPALLGVIVLKPVVIDPLFNRFVDLPAGPLRTRIRALAAEAGIPRTSILVVDSSTRTRKTNAYVSGLGPTQRIVLWDNLVTDTPRDQIEAVVAHEIGHYVLGHRWRQFVLGSAGAGAVLWLLSIALRRCLRRFGARWGVRGPGDLAALPAAMLILSLILFVQSPIDAALSRVDEREADRYGLSLTGNSGASIRQYIKFVRQDYADPDPPPLAVFWFYSHPPIRERIDAARRWMPRGSAGRPSGTAPLRTPATDLPDPHERSSANR